MIDDDARTDAEIIRKEWAYIKPWALTLLRDTGLVRIPVRIPPSAPLHKPIKLERGEFVEFVRSNGETVGEYKDTQVVVAWKRT